MPELPAEKIHEIRQAVARLRCAAHELDVLLADLEPTSTTTALIDPRLTDFIDKVLPADEKQRLTEILPQLADGAQESDDATRKRATVRELRRPRRPRVRQS
jgi:hypothetical protein